jgi:opacity protein-like surface antigen
MKSFLFFTLALVSAALLFPQPCGAQYPESSPGFYFRAGGGPAFTEDSEVTEFTGFPTGNKIEYNTGFALDLAAGYAFNPWVSTELETGWIGNEVDSIEGFTVDDTFFYNVPVMANVTFRFPIPRTIVTPYIGAGAGASLTTFDTEETSNGTISLFDYEDDEVFAYQFFAGVRFDLNENMSLGAEYKYFATDDSTFSYRSLFGGPPVKLGIDGARSHVVTVSFAMKF